MTTGGKSTNSTGDFIEYMASFKNLKEVNINSATSGSKDVINIDSTTSDSSSDEIVVVKELKVTVEDHRCDLCCEGEFLIDRLLRFGGLINETYKFVCDKCDKNFVHKSELKKHSSQCKGTLFHQNGDISVVKEHQPIICSACSKSFKTQGGLTKHMNSQHSGLTHTCEVCKTVFNNFQQFRHHCFEHQRRRMNYRCSICSKRFHYRSNFQKHMKKHSNS